MISQEIQPDKQNQTLRAVIKFRAEFFTIQSRLIPAALFPPVFQEFFINILKYTLVVSKFMKITMSPQNFARLKHKFQVQSFTVVEF